MPVRDTSPPDALDPFELFGVDPASADERTLARAFRELSALYPADDAPATRARIQEAYNVARRQLRQRSARYTDTLVDVSVAWAPQFSPPPRGDDSEGAHAMADAEEEAARLLGEDARNLLVEFTADVAGDDSDTDIDIPMADPDADDEDLERVLSDADVEGANAELVERLAAGQPIAGAVVVKLRGARLQTLGAAAELEWDRLRSQEHRWAAIEVFEAGLVELLLGGRTRRVIERLQGEALATDLPDDKALQRVVLSALCALAWRARRPAARLLDRLFGPLPDDFGDQRQHLVDRFRAVVRFADRWAAAREAGHCPDAFADLVELSAVVNGPGVEALTAAVRDSLADEGDQVWATVCAVAELGGDLLAYLDHELAQVVGPELPLEVALVPAAAEALGRADRASLRRPWNELGRWLQRDGKSAYEREVERLAPLVFESGLGPDNIANWAQTRGAARGLERFARELRTDGRLSVLAAVARARLGLQRPGAAPRA